MCPGAGGRADPSGVQAAGAARAAGGAVDGMAILTPHPVCVTIAEENRALYEETVARVTAWVENVGERPSFVRDFVARDLAFDLASEVAADQADFAQLVAGIAVALSEPAR